MTLIVVAIVLAEAENTVAHIVMTKDMMIMGIGTVQEATQIIARKEK